LIISDSASDLKRIGSATAIFGNFFILVSAALPHKLTLWPRKEEKTTSAKKLSLILLQTKQNFRRHGGRNAAEVKGNVAQCCTPCCIDRLNSFLREMSTMS
jgi:hypothetical protein